MRWLCKFWHSWEYITEDSFVLVGLNNKPTVFFHEITPEIAKNFNLNPTKISCRMRMCMRCSKKQVYYKGLMQPLFTFDLNQKKTWVDYNILTIEQLREIKLKSLGLK
jgi:hypothetical protein